MANKKYYWLKLQKDFYKKHDIKYIEALPNGVQYLWFYMKLLMESVDHEGELRFSELLPYDAFMLSAVTGTNADIIKGAMDLFERLGMIEILEDKTIYMKQIEKMIGSEGDSAERVRKHRETIKIAVEELPMIAENNAPVAQDSQPEPDKDAVTKEKAKLALKYLNEQTMKAFRPTDNNLKNIIARLNEGYTLRDVMTVIRTKTIQWEKTEYAKFIRPMTLFAGKFDSYLQETYDLNDSGSLTDIEKMYINTRSDYDLVRMTGAWDCGENL